jgi:hypothetical protein
MDKKVLYHRPQSEVSATPDDKLFQHLAKVYSYNHAVMHTGRSECDNFPEGITNGAKWYIVRGGMQDFKSVFCYK